MWDSSVYRISHFLYSVLLSLNTREASVLHTDAL